MTHTSASDFATTAIAAGKFHYNLRRNSKSRGRWNALVELANHEPYAEYTSCGQVVTVPRGSFIATYRQIADLWQLSTSYAYTFINKVLGRHFISMTIVNGAHMFTLLPSEYIIEKATESANKLATNSHNKLSNNADDKQMNALNESANKETVATQNDDVPMDETAKKTTKKKKGFPPYPPLKEKEKEKENSSLSPQKKQKGEKNDFYASLWSDREFFEAAAAAFDTEPERVAEIFKRYMCEMRAKAKKFKDEADMRDHFINCLRLEMQYQRSIINKPNKFIRYGNYESKHSESARQQNTKPVVDNRRSAAVTAIPGQYDPNEPF